ncbi:MAG: Holliday junction branch migration protein RuvA [Spirochaetales bacterium]|nr:MAG: Holliday junction branch migration protein RuvA [Spirochaetales bacterium]
MINSISGTLTFKAPEQCGVETGGIEWAVDTTATSLSLLPRQGEAVRLFTYLHHTQDQMRLFGFFSQEERRVFLSLITVNGVGPSLARKILSGTTPQRFQAAVDTEDLALLSSIPGLGKKTAQKIVLQLRGKLAEESDALPPGESSEVAEALKAMGFESRLVSKAVAAVLEEVDKEALEGEEREKEILRRAIVALSS